MFKQYLPLLLLISGCASIPEPSEPINFDYNAIETIEFKLQPLPESKGVSNNTEWTETISTEISQRFAEAGYPVHNSLTQKTEPTTHTLNAQVEESKTTQTQPGFSLDFGNSNPRAVNFQKTLSAPINCSLTSTKDPSQSISLKELKSVPNPFENIGSNRQKINRKLTRFYVENIGSTCHNLLNKIRTKQPAIAKSTKKSADTFSPSIRIETKYKTDNNKKIKKQAVQETGDIIATPSNNTPVKTGNSPIVIDNAPSINMKADTKTKIEAQPAKAVKEKDYFPAITTEEKNTQDWRDAEVTIFNEGDTVILEFGNNR